MFVLVERRKKFACLATKADRGGVLLPGDLDLDLRHGQRRLYSSSLSDGLEVVELALALLQWLLVWLQQLWPQHSQSVSPSQQCIGDINYPSSQPAPHPRSLQS